MDTQINTYQNIVPVKIGELVKEDRMIIRLKIFEDAELDAPEIEELFLKGNELSGDRPYCLLTDARTHLHATKEAREYAAENIGAANIIANAILANSLPVVLLVNFYIKINRPEVPTKMFQKEPNAIAWLNSFIDGEKGAF